jgi:hypothetical protein
MVLPVCGWLMAVLLLQMFSTTVENLKCSYALSDMCCFNDLEKPGTLGIPDDGDRAF